ncbi:MAG: hypothetical protein JSU81_07435 [Candidatus Coatesbacteria bacterium]|nr:MAG: hypothetical protein JSU81_07435 [Candidatus Coatesbacteria bacterium]
MPGEEKYSPEEIEDGKVLAAIGYVGILFLVPLLVKPENKFCRDHAKQGLVCALAAIPVLVPFIGWMWGVFVVTCAVMGFFAAYNGEYKPLPLFGALAEKITI